MTAGDHAVADPADTVDPPDTGHEVARFSFRAMATEVSFFVVKPGAQATPSMDAAAAVFARVEAACTRFDPGSPLMRANAAGDDWYAVPPECFEAISEAARAYEITGGVFDPRVLDSLVALGYDRSLPFTTQRVRLDGSGADSPDHLPHLSFATLPPVPRLLRVPPVETWRPGLDAGSSRVRIGPRRIDLGGIGKGLAVRWASVALAGAGTSHLIDAGGDLYMSGPGPLGMGWRVGVQDPLAPFADGQSTDGQSGNGQSGDGADADPIAVLELTDAACATSSLRVRSWTQGTTRVHHLIDPRTGRSCESGLRAVTVAGPDTAEAEVWSKALLIQGAERIASVAAARDLAALWVDDGGVMHLSEAMRPHVIWRASP